MNIRKLIITLAAVASVFATVPAQAYGEVWCKVSVGTIQACFATFDQCDRSIELGVCKPFKK